MTEKTENGIKREKGANPGSRRWWIGLLLLFIIINLAFNFLYILGDLGVTLQNFFTDMQFVRSVEYYEHFVKGIKHNLIIGYSYPPFVYITTMPYYALMGISMAAARFSMSFYTVIFLLAMFGIGRAYGDNWSGFSVMALGAASPQILNVSRVYFLDFPETALTALTFFFLLKSAGFADRKYSILTGAALGIAFLTKWSTAFFIICPLLWFIIPAGVKTKRNLKIFAGFLALSALMVAGVFNYYHNLQNPNIKEQWLRCLLMRAFLPGVALIWWGLFLDRKFRKNKDYAGSPEYSMINILLFAGVFVLIASPWYYWAGEPLTGQLFREGRIPRNPGANLVYMWHLFANMYSFVSFFILGGIYFLFKDRRGFYEKLLLPVNILFIVLIMSRAGHPDTRYYISSAIFFAALGGYWISNLKKAKTAMTIAVLFISLVSITAWTAFPGDAFFLHPVKQYWANLGVFPVGILTPNPPEPSLYDLDPVMDELPFSGEVIYLIHTRSKGDIIPVDLEVFIWEARQKGRNVIIKSTRDIADTGGYNFENLSCILVIYPGEDSLQPVVDQIRRLFPYLDIEIKTFEICREFRISVIRFSGDQMDIYKNPEDG